MERNIDTSYYLKIFESNQDGTFDFEYYKKHKNRYDETVKLIEGLEFNTSLEIGATDFFQVFLKNAHHQVDSWGTIFSDKIEEKFYKKEFQVGDFSSISTIVSLDIESELFPIQEEYFDLVLMCEVIEHLDIDPMFTLAEFNRIIKPGKDLVITTPNCCSARNFWKIAKGYRPHFFMQYEKSRSPYRHNFEHDVHSLRILLEAAGFSIVTMYTENVFEAPIPEAEQFLQLNGLEVAHRGDDIFIHAKKTGNVQNRWPDEIYV